MRDVWSDENRTAKYLDIERALAKVQGDLGIIPKEAADEIVRNCNLSQIDWAKLQGHRPSRSATPSSRVVNQINANCRDKLGEYCHWGATTQDITDTAAVLQMREGLALGRAGSGRDRRCARRRWRRSTATRPSSAAPTCSRPRRSPSATRWRASSPASSATASASSN